MEVIAENNTGGIVAIACDRMLSNNIRCGSTVLVEVPLNDRAKVLSHREEAIVYPCTCMEGHRSTVSLVSRIPSLSPERAQSYVRGQ
jgi:hypothetical protein